jgi:hypothetical protein
VDVDVLGIASKCGPQKEKMDKPPDFLGILKPGATVCIGISYF